MMAGTRISRGSTPCAKRGEPSAPPERYAGAGTERRLPGVPGPGERPEPLQRAFFLFRRSGAHGGRPNLSRRGAAGQRGLFLPAIGVLCGVQLCGSAIRERWVRQAAAGHLRVDFKFFPVPGQGRKPAFGPSSSGCGGPSMLQR